MNINKIAISVSDLEKIEFFSRYSGTAREDSDRILPISPYDEFNRIVSGHGDHFAEWQNKELKFSTYWLWEANNYHYVKSFEYKLRYHYTESSNFVVVDENGNTVKIDLASMIDNSKFENEIRQILPKPYPVLLDEDEVDEEIEERSKFKYFTVDRVREPALKFKGILLAMTKNHCFGADEYIRLSLYKTVGGKYVYHKETNGGIFEPTENAIICETQEEINPYLLLSKDEMHLWKDLIHEINYAIV